MNVMLINVLPSLFLLISPFVLARSSQAAQWNEPITGLAIAGISVLTAVGAIGRRLGAAMTIAAAIWLFASPLLLNLPVSHSGADRLVACLVITVCAIELLPGMVEHPLEPRA